MSSLESADFLPVVVLGSRIYSLGHRGFIVYGGYNIYFERKMSEDFTSVFEELEHY